MKNDNKNQKTNTKIRKDDTVMVHTGTSKGKTGKVFRRDGDKVFVQGLNKAKKHTKKTQQNAGGILEIERPIHVSKLSVVVKDNKPVKLRVRKNDDGVRELYYKQDGKEIAYRQLSNKSA